MVAEPRRPARYSRAPATWGTCGKCARCVRKRPISRSGFIPSSSTAEELEDRSDRRKTMRRVALLARRRSRGCELRVDATTSAAGSPRTPARASAPDVPQHAAAAEAREDGLREGSGRRPRRRARPRCPRCSARRRRAAGDDGVGLVSSSRRASSHRREGEGQRRSARVPVHVVHVDQHGQGDGAARRPGAGSASVDASTSLIGAGLAAEPAPRREEPGQDPLRVGALASLAGRSVPRAGHLDDGAGAGLQPRPGATLRWRPRREPVEGVGAEGEQVGQLADRRELRAGRTARPAPSPRTRDRSSSTYWAKRERLATTRMRLVLDSVRTKASTFGFVGLQELERAPAERLVLLAQGDEPLASTTAASWGCSAAPRR